MKPSALYLEQHIKQFSSHQPQRSSAASNRVCAGGEASRFGHLGPELRTMEELVEEIAQAAARCDYVIRCVRPPLDLPNNEAQASSPTENLESHDFPHFTNVMQRIKIDHNAADLMQELPVSFQAEGSTLRRRSPCRGLLTTAVAYQRRRCLETMYWNCCEERFCFDKKIATYRMQLGVADEANGCNTVNFLLATL
ncbi:hypothetical protein EVAR_63456_1 [Eumeta japonica]|uniref:Uncharacterized protein n=1 Tax=Eumeta variegata TaxID=151549 RepID=A0A4C1YEX7_EUMVA|nr:hypothetical protein EVAR_63456_1 [Eumeta japonica]